MCADRRKALLRFSADSLVAVAQIEQLSVGLRIFPVDFLKILSHGIITEIPGKHQDFFRVKVFVAPVEETGCCSNGAHGKNHALVSVYAICGSEHSFFCLDSGKTDGFEQHIVIMGFPCCTLLEHLSQIWDNGSCAGLKGCIIHIGVGTAVAAVYQARLWCGAYFRHQCVGTCF